MIKAVSNISTTQGNRYIIKLCKHFARKVESHYSENKGHTQFPYGVCEMESTDTTLTFRISAESEKGLEGVKRVLESHLIMFAPKETIVFSWEEVK